MTDIAIQVENLSKKYRIGRAQERHDTLRDTLMDAVRGPLDRLRGDGRRRQGEEEIWALKDVSFQVERGEVLGIIGPNGAGKSTLLKILSRITKPTEGQAVIDGRVGSLLEVGTGFHPELTGRENIYLNGAILGMTRAEIDRKFDEILAFSEVERFIDTPVKRYSSGMSVRLAFSVAAHLDPEILLIDEVLSVGDAAFQKKCLGRMGEVASEGRTVLFVSHNMVAVQNLCERVIWLDEGHIMEEGRPQEVVRDYLLRTSFSRSAEQIWTELGSAPGNENVRLRQARVRPVGGTPSDPITMGTEFVVEVDFVNLRADTVMDITLQFYDEQGIAAFVTSTGPDPSAGGRSLPEGVFRSTCHVPRNLLNSGTHRVSLLVVENGTSVIYRKDDLVSFEVIDTGKNRGAWYGKTIGVVKPLLDWTLELVDEEARFAPPPSMSRSLERGP